MDSLKKGISRIAYLGLLNTYTFAKEVKRK
jgi:hypothetical protein